jgi:hypothetical protein
MKMHTSKFFYCDFAFNLITFHVCPYNNIFASAYINILFTLSIQNGHLQGMASMS